MEGQVVPDGLVHCILQHTFVQHTLDLVETLQLQNLYLLLVEQTHPIHCQDL